MALDHIHQRHIVHRDLKLSNLLLDQHGYLKLIDFGLCKQLGSSEGTSYTCCGTPEYLPPEMLSREGHAAPADWWAMGIIIYELLTGITPFMDGGSVRTCQQLYANILSRTYRFSFPPQASPELISMVSSLLNKSQATRMPHPHPQPHPHPHPHPHPPCTMPRPLVVPDSPIVLDSLIVAPRVAGEAHARLRHAAGSRSRALHPAPRLLCARQARHTAAANPALPTGPPALRPTARAYPMLHRALGRWNNLLTRAVVAPIKPVLNALGGGAGYTALADDLIKYSVPSLPAPDSWDHGF